MQRAVWRVKGVWLGHVIALEGCFFLWDTGRSRIYNFQTCKDFFCSPAFSMKQAFLSGQQHGGCNRKVCCSARGGICTFEMTSAQKNVRLLWPWGAYGWCTPPEHVSWMCCLWWYSWQKKQLAMWLVRVYVFLVCDVFCFGMILEVLGKPRMIMDMLTNAQETMHTSAESLQSFTRSERGWGGWPVIWNVLMLWWNIASQLVCGRRLCVILPPTWKCNFVRHGATIQAAHICVLQDHDL